MANDQNAVRAVAYAVRAYPADKLFFQELTTRFENQQQAFKAVCSAYKNTVDKTQTQNTDPGPLNEALTEIEKLNSIIENLTTEIEAAKERNQAYQVEITDLTSENLELKATLKNPFLIELTQINAENLRRARKHIVNDNLASVENYPTEATNAAVKYFLNNEYKSYIKND